MTQTTPQPTPCQEWQGYVAKCGYGQRRHEGRVTYVHRIAYCERHGITLDSIAGQVVRHRCDNPVCINPEHLVLGTRTDNARDRVERGRQFLNVQRGEQAHAAKLTQAQVDAIRATCAPGSRTLGQSALARQYGIDSSQVSRIVAGKYWSAR